MEEDGEYLRVNHQPRNRQREALHDLPDQREVNGSQGRSDGSVVWK